MKDSKVYLSKRLATVAGSLVVVLTVIAAGMGGAMALIGAPDEGGHTETPRVLPVTATVANKESSYTVSRNYSGRIVAKRTSEVGFELGGLVVNMLVDEGDKVRVGDVVARLDTEQLATEREQLLARLEEVRARLTLAKLNRTRFENLYPLGAASKQQLDEARFEVAALKAQTKSIRAAVRAVDVKIRKSALRVPFNAVVAKRYIDEGTVVAAGRPVFRLLERGKLEARIGLPAEMANGLPVGSLHVLKVNGHSYRGVLTAVVPDVDRNTRTVTAILAVRKGPPVPSGEIVRLHLDETVKTEGYWVPTTALTEGIRGLWTVFVLKQEAGVEDTVFEITRKEVEVLHTESSRVFVRGTLEHGDRVVTMGVHRLVPGQRVRLVQLLDPAAIRLAERTANR